jgi:uncharacterized cofD-like protein
VEVSRNIRSIARLDYDRDVHVGKEVVSHILDSDLIIFSPGSLYTSILPHLIAPEVVEAIGKSRAPILYVCNLVTQPGETDHYKVSDHLKVLNRYLGARKVDIVLANNGMIDPAVAEVYLTKENKTAVELDREEVLALGARLIEDDVVCIEDGSLRHDALKTAFLIFSWLMGK